MKQIIVMIAMVILGIFIANMVLGFEDNVGKLGTSTNSAIEALNGDFSSRVGS